MLVSKKLKQQIPDCVSVGRCDVSEWGPRDWMCGGIEGTTGYNKNKDFIGKKGKKNETGQKCSGHQRSTGSRTWAATRLFQLLAIINFSKNLQQACSLLLNKCLLKDINDKF